MRDFDEMVSQIKSDKRIPDMVGLRITETTELLSIDKNTKDSNWKKYISVVATLVICLIWSAYFLNQVTNDSKIKGGNGSSLFTGGGKPSSEIANDETTAATGEIISEDGKQTDILTAIKIQTAVETALATERVTDEFMNEHEGELLSFNTEGIEGISRESNQIIVDNYYRLCDEQKTDSKDVKVLWTENEADHFAVRILNSQTYVFICNADNSKIWQIVPEADSEYKIDNE